MSPIRSMWAVPAFTLALLGVLSSSGCSKNAQDKAIIDAAETVTSGWRTLGKVDVVRQNSIRVAATSNPAAAREALRKHEALYAPFQKALDGATSVIAQIAKVGLSPALLDTLAKAVAEVTAAGLAYERGGSP